MRVKLTIAKTVGQATSGAIAFDHFFRLLPFRVSFVFLITANYPDNPINFSFPLHAPKQLYFLLPCPFSTYPHDPQNKSYQNAPNGACE